MKRFLLGVLLFARGPLWADISITQGSGTTIATDAPGSVNYQKIKACNGDANAVNCQTVKATGAALIDLSSTTANAVAINVISTATAISNTVTVAGSGSFNVNQSTVAVMNASGLTLAVISTATTISGTAFVDNNGADTLVVTSTSTSVFGSTVTIINPTGGTLAISGTVTANAGTGTFNVNQSTVAVMNVSGGALTVIQSTAGVNASTMTVVPGPSAVFPSSQSGTWTVQPGNTANTTPWLVTGGTTAIQGTTPMGSAVAGNPLQAGVVVSSGALPTQQNNGTIVPVMGTKFGQLITQAGVPTDQIKIATMTMTTTGPTVLVASAAAATYTYICGCVATNTSATNTGIRILPQGNNSTLANSVYFGTPANFIPAGIWPGCDRPITKSVAANAIAVQADNAVSSIILQCSYYQSL